MQTAAQCPHVGIVRATRAAASPESRTAELFKATAHSRTARATLSQSTSGGAQPQEHRMSQRLLAVSHICATRAARSEVATVAEWGREAAHQRRVRTAQSPVSAAANQRQVTESRRTLRVARTPACAAALCQQHAAQMRIVRKGPDILVHTCCTTG